MTKLFPAILIILDIGAAIVYFIAGDMRRGIYWTAAAILTMSITY
jgi:hypothetical protein